MRIDCRKFRTRRRNGWTQQVAAASHGDAATPRHFENTKRPENFQQAINFFDCAGNLKDERFGSDVYDASAENLDQLHEVRTVLLIGGDFDQCKVAFQQRAIGNIFCKAYIDEFFKAGFEAMRALLVGVGDDGHTGDRFVLGRADGERVNIDGEAAREGRDAVKDARFILNISDKRLHGLLFFSYGSVAVSTSGLFGRRIMSLRDAPAATMG